MCYRDQLCFYKHDNLSSRKPNQPFSKTLANLQHV